MVEKDIGLCYLFTRGTHTDQLVPAYDGTDCFRYCVTAIII
jgi:hypothetical protein